MRLTLIALTLLAAAGALAAGCGGDNSGAGGYGSGGASTTTTAAPSGTSSGGGRAYGGGPTSSAAGITAGGSAVAIDNFAFSPATLEVKVGQKVSWTNKQQGVAHTVTADGGTFDHPMPSGATFLFAFAKAGAFAYHCTIHPSMHATIVVS
jgi:plastocyanin